VHLQKFTCGFVEHRSGWRLHANRSSNLVDVIGWDEKAGPQGLGEKKTVPFKPAWTTPWN